MNKLVTTEEYEFLINVCIFEVLFDSRKAEKNNFPTLQWKDEMGQDRASKYIFKMVTKM